MNKCEWDQQWEQTSTAAKTLILATYPGIDNDPNPKPVTKLLYGVCAFANRMGLGATCGRCGGSGRYAYNPVDGTRCYGCNGVGYRLPRLTKQFVVSYCARIGETLGEYNRNLAEAKQQGLTLRQYECRLYKTARG